MIELEEDRPIAAFKLAIEFEHHLAAPVIAFDEAVAFGIGGVAAERPGHIGAGGAVVIFDQRVDLKAFEIGERRAGVKGHCIAIAAIGGVLVSPEEIARGWQSETPGGAAGKHHRLGADDDEFRSARIDADNPSDAAVGRSQQPRRHEAIGDVDAQPS